MKTGLFINTRRSQCSIYESGRMFYHSILSDEYRVDYVEVQHLDKTKLHSGIISCDNLLESYDFYIFNYHPLTMRQIEGIDASKLKNLPGIKISIILEMNENQAFPIQYNLNENDFDHYIILDPTFVSSKTNLHAFPRPLTNFKDIVEIKELPEIPIIGSFGFPNDDKNFPKIIEQASKEFEKSIVKINIPRATYMDDRLRIAIIHSCLNAQRANVDLQITDYFMSDNELVDWCRGNHLNVFLYSRNMPGLAATPDQVIISGAPLLVSDNTTFRHLHPYIQYFPKLSFKEAITNSQVGIKKIREDWSKTVFVEKFKKLIN